MAATYTVENVPYLSVTANGNGYDITCPKCGKQQRVYSNNPPVDKNNCIKKNLLFFACDNVVPVTDHLGTQVNDDDSIKYENCGFKVVSAKLIG